jgi:hypothetical protein
VGTCTTISTPGMAFAALSSKPLTVAPNRGAWTTQALSMLGSRMSWMNRATPVHLGGTNAFGASSPVAACPPPAMPGPATRAGVAGCPRAGSRTPRDRPAATPAEALRKPRRLMYTMVRLLMVVTP